MVKFTVEKPVLIAEDSPDDAFLMQLALERINFPGKTHLVADGMDVLDYLQNQGKFSNCVEYQFPAVLFLDLKMPRMTGFQVLEWLKSHPTFRVIPTIVFSASAAQRDVWNCYQLGANGYFLKPLSIHELARMMKTAFDFWSTCVLPEKPYEPPHTA